MRRSPVTSIRALVLAGGAALLAAACGSWPDEAATGRATAGLTQAASDVLDQDLPGCEALTSASLAPAATWALLRHPADGELVIVARSGSALCVDSLPGAREHLKRIGVAPTIESPSTLAAAEGRPLDPPGEPADDPVPIQGQGGGTAEEDETDETGAGPRPPTASPTSKKADVADDPVPIQGTVVVIAGATAVARTK